MDKTKLTAENFEKKVEIEAAHLIYQNNMRKEKANQVARELISQQFEVA